MASNNPLSSIEAWAGRTNNSWTVIRRLPPVGKQNLWLCRCVCGRECAVQANAVRTGRSKQCTTCQGKKKWTGGKHVSGSYISTINHRAESRGMEISLTPEYLDELWEKQEGRCKFSGLRLIPPLNHHGSNFTGSLDRIDSSKGYTEGNVQWVHKRLNTMKMNMCDAEFLYWCTAALRIFNPKTPETYSLHAITHVIHKSAKEALQ